MQKNIKNTKKELKCDNQAVEDCGFRTNRYLKDKNVTIKQLKTVDVEVLEEKGTKSLFGF